MYFPLLAFKDEHEWMFGACTLQRLCVSECAQFVALGQIKVKQHDVHGCEGIKFLYIHRYGACSPYFLVTV